MGCTRASSALQCGITAEPVVATVTGGSLSPPPASSAATVTTIGAAPGLWIVLLILAAVFVVICIISCVLGAFRKRRAAGAGAAQPGAGQPVTLALGPGGSSAPVMVGHNAAGQPILYAYAAQPMAQAYPASPQFGREYDPATAAAIAAAEADSLAEAEFEEATRKALMESAAEAARTSQGQWQQPARTAAGGGGGSSSSSRGISVAVTMPPASMPTAPGPPAAFQQGALPPAAIRALVASQNRALGLPAVRPPAVPPAPSGGGGWDPEALR